MHRVCCVRLYIHVYCLRCVCGACVVCVMYTTCNVLDVCVEYDRLCIVSAIYMLLVCRIVYVVCRVCYEIIMCVVFDGGIYVLCMLCMSSVMYECMCCMYFVCCVVCVDRVCWLWCM